MKRNFSATLEPRGVVKDSWRNRFVVQKHQASHLHYDLRLEMGGVLKSWAVPKEPPAIPNLRRLAIEVEDHPVDYITFEGRIPEGEYGAGTVEIWDKGVYNLKKREDRVLDLDFDGKILKGNYKLVKLQEKQWLFFKSKSQEIE